MAASDARYHADIARGATHLDEATSAVRVPLTYAEFARLDPLLLRPSVLVVHWVWTMALPASSCHRRTFSNGSSS